MAKKTGTLLDHDEDTLKRQKISHIRDDHLPAKLESSYAK